MRKLIYALIFVAICLAGLCSAPNKLTANATDDSFGFYTTVEAANPGEQFAGYDIPNNNYHYYKVSLCIFGTDALGGYSSVCGYIMFDPDLYECVLDYDEDLEEYVCLCVNGDAIWSIHHGYVNQLSVNCDYNNTVGIVSVGTIGNGNYGHDGIIVTVLIKTKTATAPAPEITPVLTRVLDSTTTSIVDYVTEPDPDSPNGPPIIVTYAHTFTIYYTLGDINGDGEIDAADAQLLTVLTTASNQDYESIIEQSSGNYSGMYFLNHLGEQIFLYQVGDINSDGALTSPDATRILTEYVRTLSTPGYEIGYGLGQTFSYTYTYYTTSP